MRKLFSLALLSVLLVPLTMMAQNVTISPTSGNMIAGLAGGNTSESGKVAGFYSTWVHKQLALTVNTSDIANLTSAGDVADPACTLTTHNGKLVLANGNTQTFMVVSLPKGYRITGYEIVLQPDLNGESLTTATSNPANNFRSMGTEATCFYETEAWGSDFPYYQNSQQSGTSHLSLTNYLAVATASDGDKIMNPGTDGSKTFTIKRTGHQNTDGTWDMGNRLYFWVGYGESYYGFSINSFEIYFTAEGTFDAEVTPAGVGTSTNYVKAPFTTSKTDLGAIEYNRTLQRYIYTYENVRDIKGNIHLYQEDAVQEGVGYPQEATGDIHPVSIDGNGHYAFGNNTYFIEPPTTISTPSGIDNQPIGFRIVGATFTPLWAESVTGGTQDIINSCYIYRSTNSGYLTSSLDFGISTSGGGSSSSSYTNVAATWQFDEYGNMYIGSGDNKQYLACYGEGNIRQLSLSSNATGDMARWNLRRDGNGRIYYKSDGNKYYYLYTILAREGGNRTYRGYLISDGNEYPDNAPNYYSTTSSSSNAYGYTEVTSSKNGTQTVTLPSYYPGKYTLTVYDENGTRKVYEKTFESASDTEASDAVFTYNGYNNDAVKFVISGLEKDANNHDTQALVDVTLKLEALNPYIDRMTVNCTDPEVNIGSEENPQPLRISQTFTASDFGVNGGAFHFVLPDRCKNHDVNITFEDLYSHYGDNTYKKGEGNARYSFVTSPYFLAFDDVTSDESVKSGDDDWETWMNDATSDLGLYDNRYDPNIASTKKIYTGVAGTKEFTFNNASVLITGNGTFTEYPFSVAKYLAPTSEGGTGGEFKQIELNPKDNPTGTYYLFTADETRYNIAPTKAWEHRSYAFYKMDVSVESTTYTPNVEFVPVYDHTCYAKEILDEDGNVTGKEDTDEPFYGAVITADAAGQPGYASTADIFKIINGAAKEGSAETGTIYDEDGTTEIGSYSGKAEGLTSAKQLLYLDFSNLAGTYQITTEDQSSMADYSKTNAENVLIFLPVGASAPNNNVAYKTQAGSFRAAHDIVLTDKQPFFSPYDISLGDNKVTYAREITVDKYGTPNKQSVILPFDLTLSGNTYQGSKSSFKLTQLTRAAMTDDEENDCVKATFAAISGTAAANTPYLVDVLSTNVPGTFLVEQQGAVIKATTAAKTSKDHMFYDTEVKATYTGDGSEHTFYPRGSFSGKIYDATEDDFRGSNVFFYYGSNDMFRSSAALSTNYKTLKAYPFRSFYGYSAPTVGSKLAAFMFSYGSDEVNGISELTKRLDFAVRSGKGYLEITSGKDANVRIFNLSGILMGKELMTAGETRTVNLPAGVYIVNGVKIIVK